MPSTDIELKHVDIFTDGGCIDNPGVGGYGAILRSGDKTIELSAGYRLSTNNRMELLGVITALQKLRFRCDVTLYSDSKYVINGIELGWAKKWRANGWRKGTGEKALNSDLWGTLLDLCDQQAIKFVWVKGHAGHVENERCDVLCGQARKSPNLLIDEVYEQTKGLI
jgi:ribonuclease HI